MEKVNLKSVMFAAMVLMLIGAGISGYGLGMDNSHTVLVGLITVMAVCISWWIWAMFVISSMISSTERIISKIGEIRSDLSTVKSLLKQDLVSNRQR